MKLFTGAGRKKIDFMIYKANGSKVLLLYAITMIMSFLVEYGTVTIDIGDINYIKCS